MAAAHHGVSPKTVQSWRHRATAADAPIGPKQPRSTTPAATEKAVFVAFRRDTLPPLDDCLYARQPTTTLHLRRPTLRRSLQRLAIARLPEAAAARRGRLRAQPIG